MRAPFSVQQLCRLDFAPRLTFDVLGFPRAGPSGSCEDELHEVYSNVEGRIFYAIEPRNFVLDILQRFRRRCPSIVRLEAACVRDARKSVVASAC